jgi:hypothetical protein
MMSAGGFTTHPAASRQRLCIIRCILGFATLLALFIVAVVWLSFIRHPLPRPGSAGADSASPAWWENPVPITDAEASYVQYLSSVTWQLPHERWMEHWNVGGQQYGVFSIRYQAAFAGYAFAALGMRIPACPAITGAGLCSAIDHLLERRAWAYVGGYWQGKPWFPDPVAEENVMYSGHLLQLVVLYEAMTGDDRYRTQGFDFIWDEKTRFHYTTLTLAEAIVRQMRRNESGGVSCEPGLVFLPCNNHPQLALLLMEKLGLGNWSAERQKWETWALDSYAAPLGQGAIRLAYYLPLRAFIPAGHQGLDGWSLLWYQPWASGAGHAAKIWQETARRVDWNVYANHAATAFTPPEQEPACCRAMALPLPAVASFLYPAAVACGDAKHAGLLREWLGRHYATNLNGSVFLNCSNEYRIGVTANMTIAELLRGGSNFRDLVHRPMPRDYFKGPLITELGPPDTRVYQAWRRGQDLIVECDSPSTVRLRLANVSTVQSVSEVDGWQFGNHVLSLPGHGRRFITIKTASDERSGKIELRHLRAGQRANLLTAEKSGMKNVAPGANADDCLPLADIRRTHGL